MLTHWGGVRRFACLAAGAVAALAGCGMDGPTGPGEGREELRGRRLTSLGFIAGRVQWSADGTEIYASRYDGLVIIEVASGAVRRVTDPCGMGFPLETIAGPAHLHSCDGSGSLHLLRSSGDTVLATNVFRAMLTRDRARLIYAYHDTSVLPCLSDCIRIAAVDLRTMVASPVTSNGVLPPEFGDGFTTTNGTELLASTALSPKFFLVPLIGGAWSERVTDWLEPNGLRRSTNMGPVIGWNAQGIWSLPEVSPLALGEALTGRLIRLPQDTQASITAWEGGFMAPDGNSVALWRSGCEVLVNDASFPDGCKRYYFTLWLHSLDSHTNSLLAAFRVLNADEPVGVRDWKLYMSGGSFAPTGRKVGYIMDGDVYVSDVP